MVATYVRGVYDESWLRLCSARNAFCGVWVIFTQFGRIWGVPWRCLGTFGSVLVALWQCLGESSSYLGSAVPSFLDF